MFLHSNQWYDLQAIFIQLIEQYPLWAQKGQLDKTIQCKMSNYSLINLSNNLRYKIRWVMKAITTMSIQILFIKCSNIWSLRQNVFTKGQIFLSLHDDRCIINKLILTTKQTSYLQLNLFPYLELIEHTWMMNSSVLLL